MNKKLIFSIVTSLICGLLTGCYEGNDTWFNHTLKLTDEQAEQPLVVSANLRAGEHPTIIVNTAYAVSDPERIDTVHILRHGYLHDANVQMRINGGAWMSLSEEDIYYTCDYVLRPSDSVEIVVSDSKTGRTASASTKMPERIVARAIQVDAADYKPEDVLEGKDIFYYHLLLDGLPSAGSLLRITSHSYATVLETWTDNFQAPSSFSQSNTVTCGRDACFERYSELSSSMAQGWFGSHEVGLFADVPQQDCSLLMAAVCNSESESKSVTLTCSDGTKVTYETSYSITYDSVVIDVELVSRETYLYMLSLAQNKLIEYEPHYDFWMTEDANEVKQITKDIEEMFSILGEMESYAIFSNVNGGYGRVLASSGCRLVIVSPR